MRRAALTKRGQVKYERQVYECPLCRASLAPLDRELGLKARERFTSGLGNLAAWFGAQMSYGKSAEALWRSLGLGLSKAEIARLSAQMGALVEEAGERRDAQFLHPVSPLQPAPAPERQCQSEVLTADAASVLTVKGEEHKMVYCGRAFDALWRAEKEESHRPFLLDSLRTASGRDMEEFGRRFKALGYRAGMRKAKRVAFIADGARCLWDWARENLGADTTLILDFWHVCQYLAAVCEALYGPHWKATYQHWKGLLRDSDIDVIITEISLAGAAHTGETRKQIDSTLAYLRTGRDHMDYARYRDLGLPIGSGAIEGECKHLVKQRFNLTGARWKRARIPAQLALCLSQISDTWDCDWESARQLSAEAA